MPGGQLGQLAGPNRTNASGGNGTGQQAVVEFARSLQQTNKSNAQRLVRENPSKSAQIVERVGSEYPGNTTQQLRETPKQVAGLYLGLVGSGRPNRGDNGPSGRSNGGDGGGGLFGFSMRSDVIQPTLNATKKGLKKGMMWTLNRSMEVTVGTPVPEDEDNNGIVFIPTNDGWLNMYHQYFIPYIFPLALVLALASMIAKCGLMPWRALRNPSYSQSQAFVGFVLTLFAIAFTVPIIGLMHTFVDVLATNVAPSPKELTQSTKGIMNLGSGAIFAVLGAVVIGYTEALGLAFIYALRYGALFVVPWFLPLLVALAYNAPHKRLSGFASEMIWQYIGLLIQAFPVALLLRAAYALQWDFGYGGFIGMLASGAIFLTAIGLPILTSIGMFKAAPSVQSVASGAAGYVAGSQASNYARQAPGEAARGGYSMMSSTRETAGEKFGQLKDAVREYREGGGSPERGQATITDFEDRTHPSRERTPTLNGIDNSPDDPTPLND
jgi:hypothetical protein